MSVLLFIVSLLVSIVFVRIGAIAFQLTGLQKSVARFQALSCFTGTGFTTSEAELITGVRQRRRIATILMIAGHVGLVALVATFANSLRPNGVLTGIIFPFLPPKLPLALLPWINLGIIVAATYAIYRLSLNAKYTQKLTAYLRSWIERNQWLNPVPFQEFVLMPGGYGVVQIELQKDSPVKSKSLLDLDLSELDLSVLAVEQQGEAKLKPESETVLGEGDRITCFGRIADIRKKFYPSASVS